MEYSEFQTKYSAKTPDENGYIAYSDQENDTWARLYERQMSFITDAACEEYVSGMRQLDLPADRTPQCRDISTTLYAATGWRVQPVPALIDVNLFFSMLSQRIFPAASFMRRPEEFDYLSEPDLFHEMFGHGPLLTHPDFADFTAAYGKLGLEANEEERKILARLYWYTVEFGLIQKPGHTLAVYGAGIASSIGETQRALHSDDVERIPFDLDRVLRTPFRIDKMQPHYFVLSHFSDLFEVVEGDLMRHVREVIADEARANAA
ncbi:MAG: phenylalanine 4-monooxygenase [Pseudomonadota bacterium]